ncbi:NAD-binding protein [Nocardioides rotundus]|uniref:ion channel n=1 Tax=Nocardioides rotundus TaxID=1774216 RepID=UPI001CC1B236|nr:ion channel [Nocardioides rotundus]UAL29102.1 NAD-binding protein [Nocardioides rotundus]
MILLLERLRRRAGRSSPWLLPLLIAGFVFVTGWAAMALAQPGSEIAAPENFWWWFVVTATTVGYGDYYPETTGGRLVGAYVVVGSIVAITALFGRLMSTLESAKGRRMQGLASYQGDGHLVILGYTPGRTERLIRELLSDERRTVVLCAWEEQAAEHPMAGDEHVEFVRGDLTDLDVLRRAAPDRAEAVLVDARDDNEAVTLTVAAEQVASGVHTVVTLRDLARSRTVRRIDDTVQCVQWHSLMMVTEELADPGIAEVYAELMTAGGQNSYAVVIPDGPTRTYGEWLRELGERHRSTALAVRDDDGLRVSPDWESPVAAGSTLYYVGPQRLAPDALGTPA